jgi:hypothetical protein
MKEYRHLVSLTVYGKDLQGAPEFLKRDILEVGNFRNSPR